METLLTERQLIAKQKLKDRSKREYERNKDTIKARANARYTNNRTEMIERQKIYNKNNVQKYVEYSKTYYQKNKDDIKARHQRQREQKRQEKRDAIKVEEKVEEKVEGEIVLPKKSKLCEYCNIEVKLSNLGPHEITNKHLNNKLRSVLLKSEQVVEHINLSPVVAKLGML